MPHLGFIPQPGWVRPWAYLTLSLWHVCDYTGLVQGGGPLSTLDILSALRESKLGIPL